MTNLKKIRNIAIVAHIDHGKTTLLDSILKQAQIFRQNEQIDERVMDSYDQEKERGITIFSKNTAVFYKDYKINIIDTPGHADFSAEVERVLGMVDSVLLLIDAKEGPMPQTRFVLSKALKMGLKPIVVLNKIDRAHADPDAALDKTFDLFTELGANDDQLDFAFCYASGIGGFAMREVDGPRTNLNPLFDLIIEAVPAPKGDPALPFLMQVATVSYDDYIGRQGCGRIINGIAKRGQPIVLVDADGGKTTGTIQRIQVFHGLKKVEVEEANAGDIALIAGIPEVMVSDTICSPSQVVQLPRIAIDEPTVSIDVMVNSSPLVGRDGKHVTMNKIRDRLEREKRANVSLKINESNREQDALTVCGRGELHLSVLLEAMRREGFEMSVAKPQVIIKIEDGVKLEPIERAHVEVPEEYSGRVIEDLSKRKGEMQSLHTDEHGITAMEFSIPTRGLMGYRNDFLTITRGLGILTTIFDCFGPWRGEIPGRMSGVLISMTDSQANSYACYNLQSRGSLFVQPGDDVYEGMVVGENRRDNDLVVNVTKGKQLTNVRASGKDENIILTPPMKFTLEQAIDYVADDELVEITPNVIRLRKRFLKENDRKRKQNVSA